MSYEYELNGFPLQIDEGTVALMEYDPYVFFLTVHGVTEAYITDYAPNEYSGVVEIFIPEWNASRLTHLSNLYPVAVVKPDSDQ